MKYLECLCVNCDTKYVLEFDDDNWKDDPKICPFCGEDIDEDLDSYVEDDKDED